MNEAMARFRPQRHKKKNIYSTSVSVLYGTNCIGNVQESVPVLYNAIVPVLYCTVVLCCMYNTSVFEPTKPEAQACLQ